MSTKLFAAIALFAVANGALINMIMASRLTYGMSRQGIVPRIFGAVHPTRRDAAGRDHVHHRAGDDPDQHGRPSDLADTTVLLLLVVFIVVNVSVLVLRRDQVDRRALPRADGLAGASAIGVCLALMTEKTGETYAARRDPARGRRGLLARQPRGGRAAPMDTGGAARRSDPRPARPRPTQLLTSGPSSLGARPGRTAPRARARASSATSSQAPAAPSRQ